MEKPCYGKPLEEHLALSGRDIAFPIEACVTMLLECGMQEEVRANKRITSARVTNEAGIRVIRLSEDFANTQNETDRSLSPCFPSQGLFRVAPSASKLKKLKASLDCGVLDVQEYSADPHAIAGELSDTVSSVLGGGIISQSCNSVSFGSFLTSTL